MPQQSRHACAYVEAKPPASGAEEGAPNEPEPPESEAPYEREKVQPLSVSTPEKTSGLIDR